MLIQNPIKARPYWSLGRVLEVILGDDGLVRSAKIKRMDGGIQEHSLRHLFPIELSITHSHQTALTSREVSNLEVAASPVGDNSRSLVASARPRGKGRSVNSRVDNFLWY